MFEIYVDKAGEFRYRLKANNGQIIMVGEGYKQKSGVKNGIESIKNHSKEEANFEMKQGKSGKWMFNLKAGNGQVIGTSQMYTTEAAAKNGIQSVMNHAADAEVKEV